MQRVVLDAARLDTVELVATLEFNLVQSEQEVCTTASTFNPLVGAESPCRHHLAGMHACGCTPSIPTYLVLSTPACLLIVPTLYPPQAAGGELVDAPLDVTNPCVASVLRSLDARGRFAFSFINQRAQARAMTAQQQHQQPQQRATATTGASLAAAAGGSGGSSARGVMAPGGPIDISTGVLVTPGGEGGMQGAGGRKGVLALMRTAAAGGGGGGGGHPAGHAHQQQQQQAGVPYEQHPMASYNSCEQPSF